MPYDVELPNGDVIEVPDNVSQAEAKQRIYKAYPQFAPKQSTERTFREAITDPLLGIAKGVGAMAQLPGQLYGLATGDFDTAAMRGPEKFQEYAKSLQSEGLHVREALRDKAISEAEKKGIASEFYTAITQTLKDPALITTFITEQIPEMIPMFLTGGASRLLTTGASQVAKYGAKEAAENAARVAARTAIGTGAVQQGADIGADTYKEALDLARAQNPTMSPQEIQDLALSKARAASVESGIVSLLAQKLPGSRAIERRMAGLPGEGRIRSGLGEAASEMLEEGGGKFASNVNLQQIDPERSLTAGVGSAAGLGAIGGGILGTAIGHAAPAPELMPGQSQGETLVQSAERLQKEIRDNEKLLQQTAAEKAISAITQAPIDPVIDPFLKDLNATLALEGNLNVGTTNGAPGRESSLLARLPGSGGTPAGVDTTQPNGVVPPGQDATGVVGREGTTSTSVEPVILQNRDRATPAAITQMQNISANPDYTRLGFSRDITFGAPVVFGGNIAPQQLGKVDVVSAGDKKIPIQYAVMDANDVVASNTSDGSIVPEYSTAIDRTRAVGGNGRIAGLQAAYQNNTAANYNKELLNDDFHGISPDVIKGIKNPVLVRVMPTTEVTKNIGDLTNTSSILKLSPTEQAKNDAARVDLNNIDYSEDGDVTDHSVVQFIRSMPQSEHGDLIDSNGVPTRQAKDRLHAAIFASAYKNDELIRLYAQATDPEAKNVLNALSQAAPQMARLEGAGALDFRNEVVGAVERVVNAKRAGISTPDMVAQVQIGEHNNTHNILTALANNIRSAKRMAEILKDAANYAYHHANTEEQDMFGEGVPKPTKEEITQGIKEGKQFIKLSARGQKELFESDAKKQQKQAKEKFDQQAVAQAPKVIAEKKEQFKNILTKILSNMGLKDVAVKLMNDIEAKEAEGSYSENLIKIALDAASPVRTLRHEAIHALKELGFFSENQWNVLLKQAKDVWVDKYLKNRDIGGGPLQEGKPSRYDAYMKDPAFKADPNAILEEAIADAFGDFEATKPPPGMIQAILKRMKDFFAGLKRALNGAGFLTSDQAVEQLFGKIARGELKAGETKAGETPSYSLRSPGKPATRENVVGAMEMAQEKQPYMNCQLCVQMATGVSKILELPKVNKAQIGDIYTFNERKNMASHYAVDVGSGNVAEVEEWGEQVRVVPLSKVVDEYDKPSAIRRAPETAYTREKFSLGVPKPLADRGITQEHIDLYKDMRAKRDLVDGYAAYPTPSEKAAATRASTKFFNKIAPLGEQGVTLNHIANFVDLQKLPKEKLSLRVPGYLYHRSNLEKLANVENGDKFVLQPGPQGAEGKGVYFSQDEVVRETTAEGTARKPQTAVVVIKTPLRDGWYVSKTGKTIKYGKPRTWHTENKTIDLQAVDVKTIEGEKVIFAKPISSWVNAQKKLSLRAPNTEAFKQWFGDSKVVDENGDPLVVYHGTYSDIDKFKTTHPEDEESRFGAHFGPTEAAEYRLESKLEEDKRDQRSSGKTGPNIVPAYLSIQRPLRLEENRTGRWGVDDVFQAIAKAVEQDKFSGIAPNGDWIDAFYEDNSQLEYEAGLTRTKEASKAWQETYLWKPGERSRTLKAWLKAYGYDGIVYDNKFEGGGDSYIALYPGQIKSATGNIGTYDRENPDIRYSLRITKDNEIPDLGKDVTVNKVGEYFDDEVKKTFGSALDYNDKVAFDRAVDTATQEVLQQMTQIRSGLDWYEEDIKTAFKDTTKIIPKLKKPESRILFTVIAGIMSPNTNARDNWYITAKAFDHYVNTKEIPGINPENGMLWMGGTQSANKKLQLDFLNNMVKSLKEGPAIDWLMSDHTVKEINEYRQKYGNIKSGIDGKATDVKPGLYAFGPKVGPFVSNLNGIHDVTVDKWMTRTFNRYFGTMVNGEGKIIDAPTEPQRRAIKELAIKVAENVGIKPYQVQSVLWFYEQQLFTKLGANSPSYGFSDGGRKFLNERRGEGGTPGVPNAAAPNKKPKLSLRDKLGLYSELENKIEAVGPNQAPAPQWKAMIKGMVQKGVKPEEIEWSGVNDYLDLQEGKVSKAALLEYLKEGGVKVEETVLNEEEVKPLELDWEESNDVPDGFEEFYEASFENRLMAEYGYNDKVGIGFSDGNGWWVYSGGYELAESLNTFEQAKEVAEEWVLAHAAKVKQKGEAKYNYGQLILPGGTNYREVLLTLPSKEPKTNFLWTALPDGSGSSLVITINGKEVFSSNGKAYESTNSAIKQAEITALKNSGIKNPIEYRSNHWDQPNVIAHVRLNDRVDENGNKVLFVEEVQSDWGQEGKREGFISDLTPITPTEWETVDRHYIYDTREKAEKDIATYPPAGDDINYYSPGEVEFRYHIRLLPGDKQNRYEIVEQVRTLATKTGRFPKAPFVTKTEGWLNLALKRIMVIAAEGDYDKVAFINGKQSAKRYNLATYIDAIDYEKDDQGTYELVATDKEGKTVYEKEEISLAEIERLVGKDIAKKIEAGEGAKGKHGVYRNWRTLYNLDLEVGEGKGMKVFYDQIVPIALKKLLPKVGGGALNTVNIPEKNKPWQYTYGRDSESFDTEKEAQDALHEKAIFDLKEYAEIKNPSESEINQMIAHYDGAVFRVPTLNQSLNQPGFDVTPEMKQKVETTGLPKFSLRAPNTKEFKQFFGDSKVVDENGEPLVVYHGTTKDFNEFVIAQKANRTNNPDGFYFTSDATEASDYAKRKDNASVMPVFLNIENPFVNDSPVNKAMVDQFEKELRKNNPHLGNSWIKGKLGDFKERGNRKNRWFPEIFPSISFPTDAMTRVLEAGGYDGFKDGRHWVAIKANQIKSATGNIGTYDKENPDIRYSLRNTFSAQVNAAVDRTTTVREEDTWGDRYSKWIASETREELRAALINRYNRLSMYDRRRADKMGGFGLLADASAEAAAHMSDLGSSLTAAIFRPGGGPPVYKNGVTVVDNFGGTIKGPLEIFAPLEALSQGDKEIYRYYQFWAAVNMAKRIMPSTTNPKGTDITFTQTDERLANDILARYPEFKNIQKEWIKYNNKLAEFLVDTGVISKDAKDEWVKYGDYIPFYRQVDDTETIGPKLLQAIAGVKPPKKRKGGTEAPLADFLETIIRNTQSSVQMGLKNVAAQRAVIVAMDLNSPGKTDVIEPLPFVSDKPDTVTILVNGKQKSFRSADKLWISSITSLNLPDVPFIGIFTAPANLLRTLVTKDPGFMLANMMRDSMQAMIASELKTVNPATTLANFASALAGRSPEFEALMNAGVLGGHEYSKDIVHSGKSFAKDLRKAAGTKKTTAETLLSPVTGLWEALEKGTTASDSATRQQIYKEVLENTKSPAYPNGNLAEAVYRSMEVMNFNRKGNSAVIRILTAAIPFLNARIQGLDVLYRTGFGIGMDKRSAANIQKLFFIRGATMFALSCMYWALTHDDDDYKKQEQETKDNYWLLPSLGIKIPIPFEIGILFKVIPERIMAASFGTDTSADFAKSMKRQLINTLDINWGVPQAFKPALEAVTNHSFFTDRPIVGQGLEGVEPGYQAGPNTSKIAAEIGKAAGLSPMKIDHLINGYTGTMGMYAFSLFDSIFKMNDDNTYASKNFEQMPVFKRFLIDPNARGTVTTYYETKNAADSVVRTAALMERTMNYQEWGPYYKENMRVIATHEYLLDLEKTMKSFREMRGMIQANKATPDEKRDALNNLTKAENKLTANIQTIKKNIEQ